MNQEKIGKLIAKLRKQKDLTQRELGEKVGVGYRAVSKWETGQTMPDISIINELSTILGISSDELLKGELNPQEEKPEPTTPIIDNKPSKSKRKLLLLLIPLFIIAIIVGLLIIRNNNKPEEYIIKSLNRNDYLVEGILTVEDNCLIIRINKIEFQDYNFYQTSIKDYKYKVTMNNSLMFGYGGTNEYDNIENFSTIEEIFKNFKIDYIDTSNYNLKEFNNKKLDIKFTFIDTENNIFNKDVKTILTNR